MNRQMSAERERRALVTRANGEREAAIAVAEGEKQAAILRSEGIRQSTVLEAEGDRQAQLLRAQGFAASLKAIEEEAHIAGANTMYLQYMNTLRDIGTSSSTKFVLPVELIKLTQQFAGSMMNGQATKTLSTPDV